MNDPTNDETTDLDRALDRALQRALPSPAVPAQFRSRLQAALVRAADAPAAPRAALESEYRRQISVMHDGYVSLQRRTLGTLIGAAFVTGITVAMVMPWLRGSYGDTALWAVPLIGAVAGVAIGAGSWLQRTSAARLLRDF